MISEGFYMDLHTAEVFFRYCRIYNVTELPERVKIVRRIVAKGQAKYLRDVDTFIEGKRVFKLQ
jgi:hypothetical protein